MDAFKKSYLKIFILFISLNHLRLSYLTDIESLNVAKYHSRPYAKTICTSVKCKIHHARRQNPKKIGP